MRRLILTCLILLMIVPLVTAQEPLTLDTEQGSMSLEIPDGWESHVEDGYAMATTRGNDELTATDVQMVIGAVDELNSVLPDPIDTDTENPALDYLRKYVASRSEGVYSEAIEVELGELPAALMLYVEKPDGVRFEPPISGVLGLTLAVYLDDETMGIALFDGAATEGDELLGIWSDILATLTVNDESLEWDDDLLGQLTPPAELLAQFESQLANVGQPVDTPTQGVITYNEHVMSFPINAGWVVTPLPDDSGMMLESADGLAYMELRFQSLTATDDVNNAVPLLEAILESDDEYEVSSEIIRFGWKQLPAAIATIQAEDASRSEGVVFALIVDRTVFTFRFEYAADIPEQLSADWWGTVTQLNLDGELLPIGEIAQVIAQLNAAQNE